MPISYNSGLLQKKTHNFQIDSHRCAIFIGHEPKACWLIGGVAVGVAFNNKAEWILEVYSMWSLGAAAFFSCNKQLFISFCGSIGSSTKLFPPKSNCSFLSMKISFAAGVKCLWGCVCVNAGTPGCLHVRGRSYGEFALVFRMLENLQFCDNYANSNSWLRLNVTVQKLQSKWVIGPWVEIILSTAISKIRMNCIGPDFLFLFSKYK